MASAYTAVPAAVEQAGFDQAPALTGETDYENQGLLQQQQTGLFSPAGAVTFPHTAVTGSDGDHLHANGLMRSSSSRIKVHRHNHDQTSFLGLFLFAVSTLFLTLM